MEQRKKSGPILPKWQRIKSKHKALSGSLFKPDITPKLNEYDRALDDYDDLNDQKKKLVDILTDMQSSWGQISKTQEGLQAERDKSEEDQETERNSTRVASLMKQPDADPDDVTKALSDLAASVEKSFNLHVKVVEQLKKYGSDKVDTVTKARDDYKAKADVIVKGLKKLEDETDKLESQISGILDDYAGIAEDMDHDEIAKDLATLKFA
jgi:chromosome segregation ATPase